jgi:transmembrane sensor
MNPDQSNQTSIEQQAADWLAKLSSGEATAEDRGQFSRWIAESTVHRETFFALRKRWQHLNEAITHGAVAKTLPNSKLLPALALAASLLLAVGLCSICVDLQNALLADHITAVGEQKNLTLADGSTVIMNTNTALAVDYSQDTRRIRLLQGEAEFIVAHDQSRPFIVAAENSTVTALGTEFSVSSWDDKLTVTVFASAVRVAQGQEMLGDLKQGQQLVLKGEGRPQITGQANLNEALAWREGKLVFSAKPLGEVVQEINRYRPGKLFLFSPSAARLPVSGIFDKRQLDSLIPVIAKEMNLKLATFNGYWIAMY